MVRASVAVAVGMMVLAGAAAAADQVVDVSIEKYQFVPQELTVKAGTTVRWTNNEKRASHSVWFKGEGIPESDRFFSGETYQRKFDKPGEYPYTCGPHPEMNGVVRVTE